MVAKPTIANSAVSIDPLKSSAAPGDEPFTFGDFPPNSSRPTTPTQDCRAPPSRETPRYKNANERYAFFDAQHVPASRKRHFSGPRDSELRIEERELQLHIAKAQERIEGTRVRAEEIRLEVQREKTATAKVQVELQGAMLAVRKLDLENERMRHELHVQQSSRDPGRAAQLDVQARIAAIQHQTALLEKDIASAKSLSQGMTATNKGIDEKIWAQRAAAARAQVDEQKARLELATRQGGVDRVNQASLDRSVSASLDLMRVLISKGPTEALMIPLAVLKQAGLTDGMLASLTASELAGALPTDGGAIELPAVADTKAASAKTKATFAKTEIARLAAENARLEAGLAVKKLKADGARGARSEPFFAIAEVRMGKPAAAAAAAVGGAEVAPRTGGPRRRISEL